MFRSYMCGNRPGSELDWNSYLKPFSTNTWFVSLVWMFSSSLALAFLYKKAWICGTSEREAEYYIFTFSESLLTVFRAICMQGSDVTPRSNACRLFFLSIYLTALVVTSAFSAALFSLLTIPKPRSPFNSLEEVLNNNRFIIGFPSDPDFHKMVEDFAATLPSSQQFKLLEKLAISKRTFKVNPQQELERVCREKFYIFTYDLPNVLFLMQNMTRTCQDKILPSGPPLFTEYIGFGFKKKNPFKELINFHLIRMKNEGIMNRLLKNYWPPQIPTVQATWVRVTLADISPILYMFASGTILGLIFLYTEKILREMRKRQTSQGISSTLGDQFFMDDQFLLSDSKNRLSRPAHVFLIKGHPPKINGFNETIVAMTDKQLINSTEDCVRECLYGFSHLYPHLVVDYGTNVVFDPNDCNRKRVSLVSGGGSGHEPFPAGYVGSGMLSASVSGAIFTSPPSKHILQAIHLASTKSAGVLLLVPNYTGDVLNFGLAAEIALQENIPVKTVIVGEDVSQELCGVSKAGKRGMCGLVLVFKIAGYLASTGCDLTTVAEISEWAVRSMASMGLCTSACSKPGVGPLFHLAYDEIELGVGVHGEAGIARIKFMPAKKAVQTLLNYVTRSLELSPGDEVVALVNNLGALSRVEEWLLSGEVAKELSERHIKVVRLYAGCFFTSLNMSGVQVCILKLGRQKQLVLKALDHPTKAPAWRNKFWESSIDSLEIPAHNVEKSFGTFRLLDQGASFLKTCFTRIADNLVKEESRLNNLDSACGDGDCGTTFSHLAGLIKNRLQDLEFTNPAKLFFDLSLMMEESIGGTTGALYGLFFKGISKQLEKCEGLHGCDLSKCWRSGVDTIKKYSKARLGDRTMLDSLETGCETFEHEWEAGIGEAFQKAVKAAADGCQRTKSMKAFAGRASYTHESQQKDVDAGAYAVVVWLSAIHQVLNET